MWSVQAGYGRNILGVARVIVSDMSYTTPNGTEIRWSLEEAVMTAGMIEYSLERENGLELPHPIELQQAGHQAARMLALLAQAVRNARMELDGKLGWVVRDTEDLKRDLERGSSVNGLGVLQGTGPGLDVAAGKYAQARDLYARALSVMRWSREDA